MRNVSWLCSGQKTLLTTLVVAGLGLLSASSSFAGETTRFKVRIDNISTGNVLKLSHGGDAPFAVSPGLWIVHTASAPLFKTGEKDRGQGLEAQAEDGNPAILAKSLEKQKGIKSLGSFNTPVGASAPGPIVPGGAYEFVIIAAPGSRLTLIAMFGQSNDLFYAPKEAGIALFNKQGKPVHGDITSQLVLWDAGTEVNQEPGAGSDQAPRQTAPNTGADEHGVVRVVNDQYTYPKTSDVLRVTIIPQGAAQM
jgi:hypothetical protein